MGLSKLGVLLVVLVFSCKTDGLDFDTLIQPEPDFGRRAVIILPQEENATVSVQCISFQDGALRLTFWFVQRSRDSTPQSIPIYSSQFVRNGHTGEILTIVNITQDLDRAQIWCGPIDDLIESRFLLGFEGD